MTDAARPVAEPEYGAEPAAGVAMDASMVPDAATGQLIILEKHINFNVT